MIHRLKHNEDKAEKCKHILEPLKSIHQLAGQNLISMTNIPLLTSAESNKFV